MLFGILDLAVTVHQSGLCAGGVAWSKFKISSVTLRPGLADGRNGGKQPQKFLIGLPVEHTSAGAPQSCVPDRRSCVVKLPPEFACPS